MKEAQRLPDSIGCRLHLPDGFAMIKKMYDSADVVQTLTLSKFVQKRMGIK